MTDPKPNPLALPLRVEKRHGIVPARTPAIVVLLAADGMEIDRAFQGHPRAALLHEIARRVNRYEALYGFAMECAALSNQVGRRAADVLEAVILADKEPSRMSLMGWHVRLEWKLEDLWIGVFWRRGKRGKASLFDVWVCLLPCLPIHISWWTLPPIYHEEPSR